MALSFLGRLHGWYLRSRREKLMLVRIVHDDPGATLSIAKGPPDAQGGIMVDQRLLETARAHGWRVEHEAPVAAETAEARAARLAAEAAGGEKTAGADDPGIGALLKGAKKA